MRRSAVVGAQRARPAFPRVQKTLAEGADRNARCARRREKGCSEHESNRNCQTDRRPRARRYPEGDTPHNADTGGRPDADNIDTSCSILVCFDGFIQENRTEVKKTIYTYTSVRERSCCSIAYDSIFVNDVRPKRRKNNQVQRIVKRPAGVEREGRSEAEERPNEARRAARRGEIIAR